MNQRALQKAHESNHPAVTRGSSADRGRGGEQDRACVRPAAAASALPPPAGHLNPGASSPGRKGLATRNRAGAAHGLREGLRAALLPLQRTAPPCTRAPRRRGALLTQGSLWGMGKASAWGERCDCASLFHHFVQLGAQV